jgi:hypothetical protein
MGRFKACSVWVVSSQMEAAMRKGLVTIAGALAIVSATLLVCGQAEAGASASAASKYATNQVAPASQVRTHRLARASDATITEFSSSSAKRSLQKH